MLYFYPKDNTPGCTTEGAQFRDLHAKFRKAGVLVAGVSRDSLKSHESFSERWRFRFRCSSDPDEALCKQFDVIRMKNMYGKQVRGIERSTFVIDKDGKLAREWRKVKVPGHAQEVLDFVKDAVTRCAVCTTKCSMNATVRRNGLCPGRERAYIKSKRQHAAALTETSRRPMVERKLRPAPSTLHLLPSRKPARTGPSPSTKLFVLDTNVLMHDPTSLFRFEEHDIYLPILTLEELDNNKKGMTEVARNARQASALPRRARHRYAAGHRGIASGIPLDAEVERRGHRAPVPADRDDHDGAAAVARERQGRQPDPRRRHAPAQRIAEAQRDPGVEGHQHAHQGARARHRRRGLLQRQGARGHRAPLLRRARAAGRLLGPPRQGHGVVAAGRPHATTA